MWLDADERDWLSRPMKHGWLPAVILLVVTAALGPLLGALARPAFLVGCFAAGWFAWRCGPKAHLQAVLVLLAFTPFVRRLVDAGAGYDQATLMILGPMLAISASFPILT